MPHVTLKEITEQWPVIQAEVREKFELLDLTYSTWIAPLRPFSLKEKTFVISFPNDSDNEDSASFITLHLTKKYSVCFQIVLEELFHDSFEIVFTIAPENRDHVLFKKQPEEKDLLSSYSTTKLNPRYTFDEFVVGKNNQYAHAAAISVADKPGMEFNQLLIYGGPGLGKTHLMNSIASYIKNNYPEKNVIYMTSEDFTNQIVTTLQKRNQDSINYHRNLYRDVDALLIDDIQFIIGKESTEDFFFHAFNYLYENKKQIVLSSDRPPKDYANLEERLRSRFTSGLTVGISFPDYETRMAILERKEATSGYSVDNEILRYIANHIKSNIRDLEGALNKIHFYSRLHPNTTITPEIAKSVLIDYINPDEDTLTPEQIVNAVADHFGIRPQDITSKKQNRDVVYPRQITIYLLRLLLGDLTLQKIGEFVGGKDHTTISYSYERISKMISSDESVRSTVELLKKKLKN